ncbi:MULTISPECIES: hypothetical protein [Myroides]|uniref:Uncharacterized protein n=1 Tax=Myroides odoratus TaxID=256 RepID=A0A378RJV0_MYROD|nr:MULTISPECIES: hypothetical protein [Myroides]MDM1399030.1 hypothetical protein [Myroides odoratimimus]QQU02112.1 hypothetical protein I6I89_09525 [Myroides odoratus]STZ26988.1 Uncharacterised protein [Myroides odoratus]
MRRILFTLILLITGTLYAQTIDDKIRLSISPSVMQTEQNKDIVEKLKLFLQTKNQDPYNNAYWNKDDFKRFVSPYRSLVGIEAGRLGSHFYQPTLMELLPTDDPTKIIAKLAYIGHNTETKENFLRLIYNIVVNKTHENIYFSSYTDFATSSWQKYRQGDITYVISPSKKLDMKEVESQVKDIERLTSFFNTQRIPITYYSCVEAKELFNIKGFDYNADMYLSKHGGLAEEGGIVYSANNAETYTHEIVHIYMRKLFPFLPTILDEGMATYFGGSGFYDYQWHKTALKKYIANHTIDYAHYLDRPYERFYIKDETPVPYLIGALICEYGIKKVGQEKFVERLHQIDQETDVWQIIHFWGLTRANINEELNQTL